MRNTLFSVLLAVLSGLLLLGSCGLVDGDGGGTTKSDSTFFRAMLNGKETWSGEEIRAFFSDGVKSNRWLTISADTIHKQNYPYTESLVFVAIFKEENTYSLVETQHDWDETGSSYYESDGDVSIASYHPDGDTSTNRLKITRYDSTTGIMEGTFRTTVVVDSADRAPEPGQPPRRRPDTLRFTDGEFRVQVEDRRDE